MSAPPDGTVDGDGVWLGGKWKPNAVPVELWPVSIRTLGTRYQCGAAHCMHSDYEIVLAAEFDAAVALLRELTAIADGMNPVPPVIARARTFLSYVVAP